MTNSIAWNAGATSDGEDNMDNMINRRVLLSSLALLPALQSQTAIAQQTRRGGKSRRMKFSGMTASVFRPIRARRVDATVDDLPKIRNIEVISITLGGHSLRQELSFSYRCAFLLSALSLLADISGLSASVAAEPSRRD
jgi:hypothetical protein